MCHTQLATAHMMRLKPIVRGVQQQTTLLEQTSLALLRAPRTGIIAAAAVVIIYVELFLNYSY